MGQRHVRLRHTRMTGRPDAGLSTNVTGLRPRDGETTPHAGQPTGPGGFDSTVT
jgi:hypothetical protein